MYSSGLKSRSVKALRLFGYGSGQAKAKIAFRGQGADRLLPPTRSLVRARCSPAGLPGGGGTPLAAAVAAANQLIEAIQRRGGTPAIVFLTDGHANVALDGAPRRERALTEALEQASLIQAAAVRTLVIDTAARSHANAERLADALGGLYLPLPRADAATLLRAVQLSA